MQLNLTDFIELKECVVVEPCEKIHSPECVSVCVSVYTHMCV